MSFRPGVYGKLSSWATWRGPRPGVAQNVVPSEMKRANFGPPPKGCKETHLARADFRKPIPETAPNMNRVGVLPPDIPYLFMCQKVR